MSVRSRSSVALSSIPSAVIDEGEGPAVLLLHGEGSTSDIWRDLAMLLSVVRSELGVRAEAGERAAADSSPT